MRKACNQRLIVEQCVNKTELQRPGCLDRLAADDHVQRALHTHQARQALAAAATGQQTQTGFRQAEPGGTVSDAVVTAQRDFQPATQH